MSVVSTAGRSLGLSPGLTAVEAARRLAAYGPNVLVPEPDRTGPWATLRHVVTDPMAMLLVIASATYLALGDTTDAVIAAVALVPVVGVSVVLELRAEHALESLRRIAAPTARVIRDGVELRAPATAVVPGDAIVVREGDVVPADARLAQGSDVVVDESALTGESLPVSKSTADGDEGLWAGTTVRSGRGVAVVDATGIATRYGRIGQLVARSTERPTPLQVGVRKLFVSLSIVALAFCVAIAGIELARGATVAAAIIAGVSLAMAAIPEEFPMVFTLYLALGAWRLARDHALVRRLVGVETLGATSVICVDKTGTLTLGTIEVADSWTAPGVTEDELLRAAVFASEPQPFDPLEEAIVRRASALGIDVAALHASELVRDHPFDAMTRSLTQTWRERGLVSAYAKGALEAFGKIGATERTLYEAAESANATLARAGMRVIAVASASPVPDEGDRASDEASLRVVGLLAFADRVRPGVADAIAECRRAGVRVVMITGDHPITAEAVALDLGFSAPRIVTGAQIEAASDEELADLAARTDVFARARPEHKHRLVDALKRRGDVVAMTGDGTNDAPALREADVGIAMGLRGTEVARGAATLVLLDDDFTTIVTAVRDGRRIFENLQRAFGYLVAFHAPLLLSAIAIPVVGAPLFLMPVHLVLLELVLHPTVALVFEADPPSRDLMTRPPRRRDVGLITTGQIAGPVVRGLSLTVAVVGLYLVALRGGSSADDARGLAFVTLVVGQLLLVLTERAGSLYAWERLAENRILPWIAGGTVALVAALVLVPPIAEAIHVAPPSAAGWVLALALAVVATLWGELFKRRGRERV